MTDNRITGRIHSFQSLGTVDGPGVRFVAFAQGCPLRCACCHNPDTWDIKGGKEYTAEEIVARAARYKEYFGKDGGFTFSGGEPLLQAAFVERVFSLCHNEGINTCLDTSGVVLNNDVKALLRETDRVLLDIKYITDGDYKKYVGCGIDAPMRFLEYLDEQKIATTVRQVIIPTLNDSEEQVATLVDTLSRFSCVDKIELLPFRKICEVKYDAMGLSFPLANIPEPSSEKLEALRKLIS